MTGLQCCGAAPVNFFDKICCDGVAASESLHPLPPSLAHPRWDPGRLVNGKTADRCCGTVPYSYDQTCCQGKLYAGSGLSCCGDAPYNAYDKTKICCGNQLHDIGPGLANAACCGNDM